MLGVFVFSLSLLTLLYSYLCVCVRARACVRACVRVLACGRAACAHARKLARVPEGIPRQFLMQIAYAFDDEIRSAGPLRVKLHPCDSVAGAWREQRYGVEYPLLIAQLEINRLDYNITNS